MIQLQHEKGHAVLVHHSGGRLLCCYVYTPKTPPAESPKPYFHPLNTLQGDTLTNFRPNDHSWHHGLSLTLNTVSGVNFWGGPTFVRDKGYEWISNHGTQHHVSWEKLETNAATAVLVQTLEWRRNLEVFFREERTIDITIDETAKSWSLRWRSQLINVSGRGLSLGNPRSNGGLAGSHYTGLQFRGARELLDDHLDPEIKVVADGGLEGVDSVHGARARWMEWHGQMDTSLSRVVIHFENNTGPLHWFVRRNAPLAAFPVQFDENLEVPAGDAITFDHTLTFSVV
jgi:hypothetical protein